MSYSYFTRKLIYNQEVLLKINPSYPLLEAVAANIFTVQGEIDRRVYQLYGLTAEEIALVEGEGR